MPHEPPPPPKQEPVIDYSSWRNVALRGMLRDIFYTFMSDGIPSPHHFYITFDTRAPGVDIPNHLLLQYPEEMMIVLQHEFDLQDVDAGAFTVALKFNGKQENLTISFGAILRFHDPSVPFELNLEPLDEEKLERLWAAMDGDEEFLNFKEEKEETFGEVIQLDNFRD